jgi:ribosomal protein S18 acetylase RimI-like enzyme
VAFVQYWQAHEDTHVVALATRTASRGRGHASRLLQRVVALAHAAGYRRVTLCARSSDPIARGLYMKHGFSPADPRPGSDVPAGAIFMARHLRETG